jgi:hypothetical protein
VRRVSRLILTCYFVWLLGFFMPGHIRGRMTLGPREAGSVATMAEASCCSSHAAPTPADSDRPTPRDRANCAVCFWALGLFPIALVHFDLSVERLLNRVVEQTIAQWGRVTPIRESLGRDPPTPA